jgi:DNA-binding XRE family transcriptional regulator
MTNKADNDDGGGTSHKGVPPLFVSHSTQQESRTMRYQDKQLRQRIATLIQDLREEQNLTQGELATAAGVDRKTVNRIECGHFSPSMDTLQRFCVALGISLSSFTSKIS